MSFYDFLIEEPFVGENVTDLSNILCSVDKDIPVINVFFICVLTGTKNNIQIISSRELLKERNMNRLSKILGIEEGKKNAYNLLCYIIKFAVENNIDIDCMGECIE